MGGAIAPPPPGYATEQIILAPPGYATSTEGSGPPDFYDKTKIFQENLRVNYYLLLKCSQRQGTLFPPTWTKSLTTKI